MFKNLQNHTYKFTVLLYNRYVKLICLIVSFMSGIVYAAKIISFSFKHVPRN